MSLVPKFPADFLRKRRRSGDHYHYHYCHFLGSRCQYAAVQTATPLLQQLHSASEVQGALLAVGGRGTAGYSTALAGEAEWEWTVVWSPIRWVMLANHNSSSKLVRSKKKYFQSKTLKLKGNRKKERKIFYRGTQTENGFLIEKGDCLPQERLELKSKGKKRGNGHMCNYSLVPVYLPYTGRAQMDLEERLDEVQSWGG